MSKAMTEVTAVLAGMKRGRNTASGNPTYDLITEGGVLPVKRDAGIVYEVPNHADEDATESWVGERVVFELEDGKVVRWRRE